VQCSTKNWHRKIGEWEESSELRKVEKVVKESFRLKFGNLEIWKCGKFENSQKNPKNLPNNSQKTSQKPPNSEFQIPNSKFLNS